MLNRRHVLSLAALAAGASPAFAQDKWPSRPIRIINPGAPGGTNDILARHITDGMSKALGQPVLVEARAGAGGVIGAQYLLSQPADGYTILTHHNGIVTAPLVSTNARYDVLKDFVPLSLQGTSPLVLLAHPSMPATFAEFVAYGRANPGKLEWGTAALGGIGHLATEVLNDAAGIKGAVRVAYSGSAPATQALIGGQIKYLLSSMTAPTASLIQEGRLRMLGVASAARSPLLPGVPALAETLPGFSAEAWFGLFAKAGTPAPIVARLTEAIAGAINQPDVVEKYKVVQVVARTGAPELAELVRKDNEFWSRVVREKNLKID